MTFTPTALDGGVLSTESRPMVTIVQGSLLEVIRATATTA